MIKRFSFLFLLALLIIPSQASAALNIPAGSLIRSFENSAVYHVNGNGERYAFPNESIYFSWHDNFDAVQFVPANVVSQYRLVKNVTYKAGTLIKIPSVPKVYLTGQWGLLQWIKTEADLKALGLSLKDVKDLPESFFTDYHEGDPIVVVNDNQSDPQPVVGEAANLVKALDNLEQQTQNAWTTMALASAGRTVNLDHLKNVNNSPDDLAAAILALKAAGQDPSSFSGNDLVAQLKAYFDGSQIGDPNLINDDFWAVIALRAAGLLPTDPIIAKSATYIIASQDSSGAWGFAPGGDTDTNDTAAALMALVAAGYTTGSDPIDDALLYLDVMQNNDGGMPLMINQPSDTASDAWVVSALVKLGEDFNNWKVNGSSPLDHLKTLQLSNGSFDNNANNTAYAAIALQQKGYPL